MIDILFNIVRFHRIGNRDGYLQVIPKFLPSCFALNRHNYAWNLAIVDMCNLNIEFPEAYECLKEGGLRASLSGIFQSQIPMDQIIETNCFPKEAGGLSGIIENKGASKRWPRMNSFIAALRDHLNAKLNKNKKTYDIKRECSRKEKDEEHVKNVGRGVSDWIPNIWYPKQPIVNINDGSIAIQDVVKSALNAEENVGELLQ